MESSTVIKQHTTASPRANGRVKDTQGYHWFSKTSSLCVEELNIQVRPDGPRGVVCYGTRAPWMTFQNTPAHPTVLCKRHNVCHTSWKSSLSTDFSRHFLSLSNFFITSDTTQTEDVRPSRNSRSKMLRLSV